MNSILSHTRFNRATSFYPVIVVVAIGLALTTGILIGAFGYSAALIIGGLAAVGGLGALVVLRTEMVLWLLLASTPLTMVAWDAGFQVFTFPECLLYLACTGWLMNMILIKRRIRLVKSPLNLPIATLIAVYGVSYLRAPDLVLTSYAFGASKALYGTVVAGLIYLLVANNVKSKNVWRFSSCLLVAGVAASLIGFYQYLTGQVITLPNMSRLTSTLGVGHGGFMVYVFVLALGLIWGVRSSKGRVLLSILMLLFLSQILLTALRSAWISLGIVSVAAWLLLKKDPGLTGITLIAVGLTVMAFSLTSAVGLGYLENPYLYRFYSGLTLKDYATQSRLLTWNMALELIRGHPLLGMGLVGFREYYAVETMIPPELRMGERGISAHNMYLDTALQVGVIGLGVLVWLLIVALRQAYVVFRAADSPGERGLAFGILLMILHIIIWGMFDSPLLKMFANNFPFFAALGLLAAMKGEIHPNEKPD